MPLELLMKGKVSICMVLSPLFSQFTTFPCHLKEFFFEREQASSKPRLMVGFTGKLLILMEFN
jgi:hypothetical protein